MNRKIKIGLSGILVLAILSQRKKIKNVPYKIVGWIMSEMIPE